METPRAACGPKRKADRRDYVAFFVTCHPERSEAKAERSRRTRGRSRQRNLDKFSTTNRKVLAYFSGMYELSRFEKVAIFHKSRGVSGKASGTGPGSGPAYRSLAGQPSRMGMEACGHRRCGLFFYNAGVRTWDAIVIGGGIIGLSLSIELRKRGASVLLVERGEPGREASHAAGGMLANCGDETPEILQPLATASANLYPEFVHELQDESGMRVDLRDYGTLLFPPPAMHWR